MDADIRHLLTWIADITDEMSGCVQHDDPDLERKVRDFIRERLALVKLNIGVALEKADPMGTEEYVKGLCKKFADATAEAKESKGENA